MDDDLGVLLRRRREELGLTRQAVADDTGLSYAYLSQLESGAKSRPSEEVLDALAHVLRLPLRALLDRTGGGGTDPSRRRSSKAGRPRSSGELQWHPNPARAGLAVPAAAALAADASFPGSEADGDLDSARAQVLPALQRLLATFPPATRLVLLHELQAQALRELGTR